MKNCIFLVCLGIGFTAVAQKEMRSWHAGTAITGQQKLYSPHKKFALAFGEYGLWIYSSRDEEEVPRWFTDHVDHAASCMFQTDCEICIRNEAGNILWRSGSSGKKGKYMVVTVKGVALLYNGGKEIIWSSAQPFNQP